MITRWRWLEINKGNQEVFCIRKKLLSSTGSPFENRRLFPCRNSERFQRDRQKFDVQMSGEQNDRRYVVLDLRVGFRVKIAQVPGIHVNPSLRLADTNCCSTTLHTSYTNDAGPASTSRRSFEAILAGHRLTKGRLNDVKDPSCCQETANTVDINYTQILASLPYHTFDDLSCHHLRLSLRTLGRS
jgi:hypothetical protein